jgi:hypothetical protein
MRLGITLPELEQGASIQSGPSERILDLGILIRNRNPIAIAPITDHDHRIISVILPTEDPDNYSHTCLRITFKPLWCKTFTLCAAKKDQLLALIIKFNEGQYWVNRDGWRQSNLTLDGPGTNPKDVYNSQFVLGEILSTWPRPHIVYSVIKLIQELNPSLTPSGSPQSCLPDPLQPTPSQMA